MILCAEKDKLKKKQLYSAILFTSSYLLNKIHKIYMQRYQSIWILRPKISNEFGINRSYMLT